MRFQINEALEISFFCVALALLAGEPNYQFIGQSAYVWSTICFMISRYISRQRGVETWQNVIIQSMAFGLFAFGLSKQA